MKEKNQFLDEIKDKSKDKDVLEAIKFEDSIDYRFELVEEDAYNRGIEQGVEQTKIDMIQSMLKNNADYEFISEISGKSIDEIKELEKSFKD